MGLPDWAFTWNKTESHIKISAIVKISEKELLHEVEIGEVVVEQAQ